MKCTLLVQVMKKAKVLVDKAVQQCKDEALIQVSTILYYLKMLHSSLSMYCCTHTSKVFKYNITNFLRRFLKPCSNAFLPIGRIHNMLLRTSIIFLEVAVSSKYILTSILVNAVEVTFCKKNHNLSNFPLAHSRTSTGERSRSSLVENETTTIPFFHRGAIVPICRTM